MNKIQPNRLYPIPHWQDSTSVYVTNVDEASRTVHYYLTPFGLREGGLQRTSIASFESMVRSGAQRAFDRWDRAARCNGAGHYDYDYFVEQAAHYKKILQGETPPESSLFDEVRVNIVVLPAPEFSKDARGCDFWGHVDSLTGGCCNTGYNGGGHEASLYGEKGLQAFLDDAFVGEPLAITLEAPEEVLARPDLPPTLARLKATLPTIEAWRATLQPVNNGAKMAGMGL